MSVSSHRSVVQSNIISSGPKMLTGPGSRMSDPGRGAGGMGVSVGSGVGAGVDVGAAVAAGVAVSATVGERGMGVEVGTG